MVSRSAAARREEPAAGDTVPPRSTVRSSAARSKTVHTSTGHSTGGAPTDRGSQGRSGELTPRGPTSHDEDPISFDELYARWFSDVSRWVRALGGPAADREDLVQDVFLVAFRRLPDFDGRNPAGWLYRIARRRVRDFRRLRWFKVLVGKRDLLPEAAASQESTPVERLEDRQTGDLLERLLDRLPADQRAAFVLFEVEGCSGQEIAELQGIPLNTVWARIHSARKKLKRALELALAKERSP